MSIGHDLQEEKVSYFDLSEYTVVESGTSIQETIEQMRTNGHNCVFVLQDGKLTGIFTDRDVLRRVVDRPTIWKRPIDEVMTHNPRYVRGSQLVGDALKMMDDLHFRNAPVLDEADQVIGNLTHFALIRYLADHFPEEILNLPPTPDHFGEERHGG